MGDERSIASLAFGVTFATAIVIAPGSGALVSSGTIRSDSKTVSASPAHRTLPMSIPASQAYYWSRLWQEQERESLAEIENGDSITFDSTEDLIDWLTGDDAA